MSSLKPFRLQRLLVLIASLCASPVALAATVVVQNVNQPGEGFNDPTPATPVAGNPGTTLGAQRLNAFQAAADEWAAMLVSNVTIIVQAQMDPNLFCDTTSATLGSAGPTTAHNNFANAPVPDTWYPGALANSRAGVDLSASPDIVANFNPDIGTPGCLEFSSGWSYEISSGAPTSGLSFYNTVIHEIGHGVGFLTFVDGISGTLFNGLPDHYAQFLYSEAQGSRWPLLNNTQRAASALSGTGLAWDGPEVANVGQLLNSGRNGSGRVQMYAPSPYRPGSSVSHYDTALSPNEIMEPFLTTVNEKRLTNHLMLDIGWITMLELDVAITDGNTTRQAGLSNSYTITLDNNGPADITIVDALVTNTHPAALQGVTWTCGGSGQASCSSAAGSGNISTAVTIPLGGRVTFQVSGTISGAFSGELINTVSVELPDNIQNTALSSDSDSTTVPALGITVIPISNTTTEAGGTASFSVVLNTAPSGTVTIPLGSDDPGEGVVQGSVQFTIGDWNSPKVITATGVNDDVDDGNQAYTIVTGVVQSGDGDYNGLNPPDVAMINLDDDQAAVQVSAISGNTTEAGGTATFSVVLDSEPTADVSIGLSSTNTGEGTVSDASLTFTAEDWDQPRQVTVTGVDDLIVDGDTAYEITTAPATSADPIYDGLDATDVMLLNLDDDVSPDLMYKDGFEGLIP